MAPLRSVLQQIERAGTVDFDLAGHRFERPAQVFQEAEHEDQFLVLIWVVPKSFTVFNIVSLSKDQHLVPGSMYPRRTPWFGNRQLSNCGM